MNNIVCLCGNSFCFLFFRFKLPLAVCCAVLYWRCVSVYARHYFDPHSVGRAAKSQRHIRTRAHHLSVIKCMNLRTNATQTKKQTEDRKMISHSFWWRTPLWRCCWLAECTCFLHTHSVGVVCFCFDFVAATAAAAAATAKNVETIIPRMPCATD